MALTFPMEVARGVVALRTGSLALPLAIHVFLHLMQDALCPRRSLSTFRESDIAGRRLQGVGASNWATS
jgi:hypothetical protein